jgi:predicted porin
MKKSLFALAAVTAFAGAAQAQSSVTVYGIVDVGYVGGNERLAGPNALNNGNTVNKQNTNSFGASAQSTSRIGFRGREDLGGGRAAFFTLETAILPNQTNPNSGTSDSIFGAARSAFVGVSQKGYGQVAIGLQNTVVTDAISPTITGQFNNIVGSLLFPGQTTSSTSAQTGVNSLQGAGLTTNSANGSTNAFTFRTSNTLKVTTERFAGIQASAMAVMQDTTQTQGPVAAGNVGYTGGKNNNNGWGLGLNYTFKKFTGTAAYQSLKAVDPYTATPANAALGTANSAALGAPAVYSAGNGTAGVNVQDNQAYVGATYDFGILKAYAGWIDRKVTSQINSNVYAKRTAQEIGVRGNFTPKIEAYASVANGRITTFGSNEPTANLTAWQIGSNYILSKRTNLYAIYGQSGTSNASNSVSGPTAGANQSYNSNNYAVGVRHTF